MAYVFESTIQDSNINNVSNNTALGIRLTNLNSMFQSVYTVPEQVRENLKTLLLTQIGERYMQPEFGTNLLAIIFEPNVGELKADIQDILESAISTWLPYVSIEQLNIVTTEDDPTLMHHVLISLTYSIRNYSTDSIKIYVNNDNTVSVV
jgi:phage baseplate assembly protein W